MELSGGDKSCLSIPVHSVPSYSFHFTPFHVLIYAFHMRPAYDFLFCREDAYKALFDACFQRRDSEKFMVSSEFLIDGVRTKMVKLMHIWLCIYSSVPIFCYVFIPHHTIVVGYYGILSSICPSIRLSVHAVTVTVHKALLKSPQAYKW